MQDNAWVSLIVVVICTLIFAWRGYHNGVIRAMQRFISLAAAYVSCYLFMASLATLLQKSMEWQLIQAYLASAVILFFGVAFTLNIVIGLFASALEDRGVEPARAPGSMVGCLLGSFLGFIVIWLGGIMLDAYTVRQNADATPKVDPVRDFVGDAVGQVVGHAVSQQFSQDSLAPSVAAELASNPVKLSKQVVEVTQSQAMRELFTDPFARHLMAVNEVERLENSDLFRDLMAVPQAKELLALLAEHDKGSAAMTQERKAATLVSSLYRKAYRVQNDPRFQQISQSPEFRRLSENPSPLEMVTNPVFGQLSEIIFDESGSETDKTAFKNLEKLEWEKTVPMDNDLMTNSGDSIAPGNESGVIYRWTDEYGKKHYSEERPEGDYEVDVIR